MAVGFVLISSMVATLSAIVIALFGAGWSGAILAYFGTGLMTFMVLLALHLFRSTVTLPTLKDSASV